MPAAYDSLYRRTYTTLHAAHPDRSERLRRMLEALEDRPGSTTMALQERTKSCAVATDISELRSRGYVIERIGDGTRNGRRINRYYIRGRLSNGNV